MWINSKFKKKVSYAKTLNIVNTASISSIHIANGKNIPVIILDTTNDSEIENAIALHKDINRGRVSTIWGKSLDDKKIILSIDIIEPAPTKFNIIFDIVSYYGIIDSIINTQLVYIQPGKIGDKLQTTMSAPRLQLEVPSTHFYDEWYKLYIKNLSRYYRHKYGMSNKVAKQATIDLYEEMGKIRDFRMK